MVWCCSYLLYSIVGAKTIFKQLFICNPGYCSACSYVLQKNGSLIIKALGFTSFESRVSNEFFHATFAYTLIEKLIPLFKETVPGLKIVDQWIS